MCVSEFTIERSVHKAAREWLFEEVKIEVFSESYMRLSFA